MHLPTEAEIDAWPMRDADVEEVIREVRPLSQRAIDDDGTDLAGG